MRGRGHGPARRGTRARRAGAVTGDEMRSGVPARRLGDRGWRRPGAGAGTSAGGGSVEVLPLGDGRVALRQPADPDGPALVFTRREIEAFLEGVKRGAADFLLTSDSSAPAATPGPGRPTGPAEAPEHGAGSRTQPPSTSARS